jgi:ribosomal protein S18 acetylase RimI-like enzyme
MFKIRAMTAKDAEAVARFLAASWRQTYEPLLGEEVTQRIFSERHALENFAAELDDASKTSLVAEGPDRSICGYTMSETDEDGIVMIDRLHVDASEYGSGLAADMLAAVCRMHDGCQSIGLKVIQGNERALAFCRKQGFVVVERRPASLGVDGHYALIMRKHLKPS